MRKDYQMFKDEFPLYSKESAALCPTARNVGGVSGWLCECPAPLECAGVKQASAPVLFTHSFFNPKNLALLNDASDYIADAVIVDANAKNDFKFCFWVSIKDNLLLAVKPAQPLIDGWKEKHGGTIEAIQVKRNHQGSVCVDVSFRGDGAYGWNAIAGLSDIKDMSDHLAHLLKENNTPDNLITLAVEHLNKA